MDAVSHVMQRCHTQPRVHVTCDVACHERITNFLPAMPALQEGSLTSQSMRKMKLVTRRAESSHQVPEVAGDIAQRGEHHIVQRGSHQVSSQAPRAQVAPEDSP